MKNNVHNNQILSDAQLQEVLVAKGNKLHTEAIQQAILAVPRELGRSIANYLTGLTWVRTQQSSKVI